MLQNTIDASIRTVAIIFNKFYRKIYQGNVTNAMKLLAVNVQNGILPLNKKNLEAIKAETFTRQRSKVLCFTDTPEQVHPIKFETINADLVKRAAVRTRGGAGPLGLNPDGWRSILMAKQCANSSTDLYIAIALKSSRNYAHQIIFPHH